MRANFSSSLVALLFASAAVACGGSVGSGTTNDNPNVNGGGGGGGNINGITPPGTTTGPFSTIGSFDLTFTTAAADYGQFAPPEQDAPPSLSVKARLDIHKNAAGNFEAVMTSRWGAPSAYAVAASASSLVLTGTGYINQTNPGPFGRFEDEWETLTLPRDATGKLTGAVHGTGHETLVAGDEIFEAALNGEAHLATDGTTPELEATITSPQGPADALLPWDPIGIRAAEPVDATATPEQTRISGPNGDSLAIRWSSSPPDDTSWAGQVDYNAYVDDWTRAGSGEPWALSNGGTLVKDLAGLASKPLSSPLKFLSTGAPVDSVNFQGDVLLSTAWGSSENYGGGKGGAADSRCETGACLRFGPFTTSTCDGARNGLAATLNRLAQGHVQLRYRVLAGPTEATAGGGGPSNDPASLFYFGNLLDLQLATPGAAPTDNQVSGPGATFATLASPIDGLPFATDWTTLDGVAPDGTGPIGVAVYVGGVESCGGPAPPPVNYEVLISTITAN